MAVVVVEDSEEFSKPSGKLASAKVYSHSMNLTIFFFSQIPKKVIGVKRGAINSVLDAKIKLLESFAKLAGGGGSKSDSHSSSDLRF